MPADANRHLIVANILRRDAQAKGSFGQCRVDKQLRLAWPTFGKVASLQNRNRSRMQERDPARRRAMLEELQRTAADAGKLKAYLLKSSMIDGLRRAAATE